MARVTHLTRNFVAIRTTTAPFTTTTRLFGFGGQVADENADILEKEKQRNLSGIK